MAFCPTLKRKLQEFQKFVNDYISQHSNMNTRDREVMQKAIEHFERVQNMVFFDKQAQEAFERSFENVSDANDVIMNFNNFVRTRADNEPLNIVVAIAYAITKGFHLDGSGGGSAYGDGVSITPGGTGSDTSFYKQLYERLTQAILQVSERSIPAREAKTIDDAQELFQRTAERIRTMPQGVTRPPGQNSPWNTHNTYNYGGSEPYSYTEDDTEKLSGSALDGDQLLDEGNKKSVPTSGGYSQNREPTSSGRGRSPSTALFEYSI